MEEIKENLASMSDSELMRAFNVARFDLAEAAAQNPNSDWHQSCFAGVLVFAEELNRRGIRVAQPH